MASMDSEGHFENNSSFPEFRIVLLGFKEAGKTSAGNTILGKEEFNLGRTPQCVKKESEVAGRRVTVVDTPGWWSNLPVECTSLQDKRGIVLGGSLCPPGPHVFLLVVPVRLSYSEQKRAVLEEHLELLGDGVWKHILVLFSFGDWLEDVTIEKHIEAEGTALQRLIEKCGNRYHVFNNMNRADDSQVTELMEKIEKMVAANNGLHYEIEKKRLNETRELNTRRKQTLPSDNGIELTSDEEVEGKTMATSVANDPLKSNRMDIILDWDKGCTSMNRLLTSKAHSESQSSLASTASSGYGSCCSISENTNSVQHLRPTVKRMSSTSCRNHTTTGVLSPVSSEAVPQPRFSSLNEPPTMSDHSG